MQQVGGEDGDGGGGGEWGIMRDRTLGRDVRGGSWFVDKSPNEVFGDLGDGQLSRGGCSICSLTSMFRSYVTSVIGFESWPL